MLLSSVAAAPCEIWFMLTLQTGWLVLYVLFMEIKCQEQSPRVRVVQHPPHPSSWRRIGVVTGGWRGLGSRDKEGAPGLELVQSVRQWHRLGGKY